jgi:transposase, IS5 family
VKKSIAAIASRWLLRKAAHRFAGSGFRELSASSAAQFAPKYRSQAFSTRHECAAHPTYHPTQGAPGISTRLMVALHYLKYQHDLSDEDVVAAWVENPYWQHFSGMRYFQHRMPIDASSMTRWRSGWAKPEPSRCCARRSRRACKMKRHSTRGVEAHQRGHDGADQGHSLSHRCAALSSLPGAAGEGGAREGLTIKQSYRHVGRRLLMQSSRYAHARQMKRARACTRKLRTQLGRVICAR